MTLDAGDTVGQLPESIVLERHGQIAILRLNRVAKRNALDDQTVTALGSFFSSPPAWAKAAVLEANGDHFCAGLDLSELTARDTFASLQHSRMWHHAFSQIEQGTLPVVAVLKGAVIGGGLELAVATHIRVAEPTAFYALPEGQRGLFVGGGASVRVPKLVGVHRMADMMLTGRVLDADEGAAVGLSQYSVAAGEGHARAVELAERIASNAPLTNFAVLQALPRIAEATSDHGLMMEALMAATASSSDEAQRRMADFLTGRAAKVREEPRP